MNELDGLAERARGGDDLAWEDLVRRTQARVHGLALHYLRSAEEARDLAQDVYVKLYRKFDRFEGGAFLPWLLKMTRNACIDRIRARDARPPAEDVVVDAATPLADEPGADGEATLERNERRRLVRRAIAGMGDLNREILTLQALQGWDLQQIADELGVPLGTVKSRAHRARRELAQRVLELDPSFGAEAAP